MQTKQNDLKNTIFLDMTPYDLVEISCNRKQ